MRDWTWELHDVINPFLSKLFCLWCFSQQWNNKLIQILTMHGHSGDGQVRCPKSGLNWLEGNLSGIFFQVRGKCHKCFKYVITSYGTFWWWSRKWDLTPGGEMNSSASRWHSSPLYWALGASAFSLWPRTGLLLASAHGHMLLLHQWTLRKHSRPGHPHSSLPRHQETLLCPIPWKIIL